jgi:hypothetical protein
MIVVRLLSTKDNCEGPLPLKFMDLKLLRFVTVTKAAPLIICELANMIVFELLGRPCSGAINRSNGQAPGPAGTTVGVEGVKVIMGALATAGNANISRKTRNLDTPLRYFMGIFLQT